MKLFDAVKLALHRDNDARRLPSCGEGPEVADAVSQAAIDGRENERRLFVEIMLMSRSCCG